MHLVVAFCLPDVVAFDLAISSEVFGPHDERNRYTFVTAALEQGPVPTTSGYDIHANHGIAALKDADTIVIPGYAPHDPPTTPVINALQAAAQRGARLISVCTGAFALAAAGLLDGRRATTHWRESGELAVRHPKVNVDADVLYVCEGQVMTSAGVAAGLDLCLHLVRLDHSADAASDVARRMVVAPYRGGGQAQYVERPTPTTAPGLAATCTWALARLADPISVTAMAAHAGWAPRTFARRFLSETGTTPLRWLTAQRLLEARRLLETTDLPVDQIASRCGLGTSANLRLHLARDAATTPTAYRRTYRGSR